LIIGSQLSLGSNYQKGRVGIQLSNGEGWDPIIKRGELGSNYQKGRYTYKQTIKNTAQIHFYSETTYYHKND
jgi:hypothetical protein